jgi:hypothetical protein
MAQGLRPRRTTARSYLPAFAAGLARIRQNGSIDHQSHAIPIMARASRPNLRNRPAIAKSLCARQNHTNRNSIRRT